MTEQATAAEYFLASSPTLQRLGSVPLADRLLSRRDAAAALTECGFPVAEATLATKAARGGGPHYRKFGKYAIYRWGDLVNWAESRLSVSR